MAFRKGVPSPDGKHVAFVRNGDTDSLKVAEADGSNVQRLYRSRDACCEELTWVSNSLLVFEDDYNVKTVDLATRRVRRIAGFSDFVLSPDRHWLVGYSFSNGHRPERIAVASIDGRKCLVPDDWRASSYPASFSRDSERLTYVHGRWDARAGETVPPYRHATVALSRLRELPKACSNP
jgi:tricorn protease-like protein